jgi:hypothetical protein
VEFAVDFGSGLRRGKQSVLCLFPVTDMFLLKIHWAKGQLRFVHVKQYIAFRIVMCGVRAALQTNN